MHKSKQGVKLDCSQLFERRMDVFSIHEILRLIGKLLKVDKVDERDFRDMILHESAAEQSKYGPIIHLFPAGYEHQLSTLTNNKMNCICTYVR